MRRQRENMLSLAWNAGVFIYNYRVGFIIGLICVSLAALPLAAVVTGTIREH